jgi:prevent-host-death family protein
MTALTASAARANPYRLIDQATAPHQPIVMTSKKASAVLVSAEDWADIQETMRLLSVPGMRESIREAMLERSGAEGTGFEVLKQRVVRVLRMWTHYESQSAAGPSRRCRGTPGRR